MTPEITEIQNALWQFTVYGLALNALTFVIGTFLVAVKLGKFGEAQRDAFSRFLDYQSRFISENVSPTRFWTHAVLWLIPTYSAWIHTVSIFYILKAKNAHGLVWSMKKANDMKFFKIFNYKMSEYPEPPTNK